MDTYDQIYDTAALRIETRGGGAWPKHCGHLVHARRTKLGLTLEDVAGLVGVPDQTIWKIEQGMVSPRDYLKITLAAALGCSVDTVFPWPDKDQVLIMSRSEDVA